jgi:hypothetical protein
MSAGMKVGDDTRTAEALLLADLAELRELVGGSLARIDRITALVTRGVDKG